MLFSRDDRDGIPTVFQVAIELLIDIKLSADPSGVNFLTRPRPKSWMDLGIIFEYSLVGLHGIGQHALALQQEFAVITSQR